MWFEDDEKTGRKADPTQVAENMRTARDIEGTIKFHWSEELLTKTQVQGFFSGLASVKRRKTIVNLAQDKDDDDDNSLIEDEIGYPDETAIQNAVEDIVSQVSGIDPSYHFMISGHDICEHARRDTLSRFSVTMLKSMCDHF